MKPIVKLRSFGQLTAVLAIAAALKFYYASTNVDGLRWVLAPTTWLVEFISGMRFTFESNAGYMSSDHTFLIAASCSGINFLITAFLMLSLWKLWKSHNGNMEWHFLPLAIFYAYLTTIIANATRISIALNMRDIDPATIGLSLEQFHRLEGIVVYFGFLIALFFLSESFGSVDRTSSRPINFRRYIFPFAIYYAVTIAIPLVNGAYNQGLEFWEHSLFVLTVPFIMILPFVGVHTILQLLRRPNSNSVLR